MNKMRQGIVQIGKSDAVLSPDRLSDDDFVDVIKLVPVLVMKRIFFYKWFEFWPARNRLIFSYKITPRIVTHSFVR